MIHSLLFPLLILSAPAESPIASRRAEADPVFHCDFEEEFDKNYDNWPDDWTRQRGPGYPFYLPVEIVTDNDRQTSPRALKLQLDGGAALVYSPRIAISPDYSYVLQVHLKTEQLRHDVAYFSVAILNSEFEKIESYSSRQLRPTAWTQVEIGPITPKSQRARWAVIELHLEPTESADLVGAALFDDIWFGSLPRMALTADKNAPYNVFTNADDVAITCRVSGFSSDDPLLTFELIDVEGNVVHSEKRSIRQLKHEDQPTPAARLQTVSSDETEVSGFAGEANWSPPITKKGFYRIRAFVPGNTGTVIERSLNLAVVDPQPVLKRGEFGWSIPHGDDPLPLRVLEKLLQETGIHWVKFPVWYSDKDRGRADDLARFAEQLNSNHMQLVGLLDKPPESVAGLFGDQGELPVASIFVDPDVWRPAVDPVMTRLSLKVRWWQLGSDDDTSFVNFPNLEEKVRSIRKDLNRFGQEINLGIALRSIDEAPQAERPPWSFLSHISNPPLTASELTEYFRLPSAQQSANSSRDWIVLEPLSAARYDVQTRARDLVLRMIAAKQQAIDGIFIPDPFDPQTGLMGTDGSPGELLLAWRSTAIMISGTEFLGSIHLPNGSENRVFLRGDKAVMAVWSDQETEETIYLGKDVRRFDLWGSDGSPEVAEQDGISRQVIKVGPLPVFITGVDPQIARWRMGFEFESERIASVVGQQQTAWYRFGNSFQHGVIGAVTLVTSVVPDTRLTESKFKLAAGEQTRKPLHVTLGANVNSGPQSVRADFRIGRHRFSVYRTIHIGLGDVVFSLESKLDEKGNLVVLQHLENKTDNFVSFKCFLFAKDRRRQRRQVYNLAKGRTTNVFTFPNGEELIGTSLTLRAEEIGGVRVLNHHHTAKR